MLLPFIWEEAEDQQLYNDLMENLNLPHNVAGDIKQHGALIKQHSHDPERLGKLVDRAQQRRSRLSAKMKVNVDRMHYHAKHMDNHEAGSKTHTYHAQQYDLHKRQHANRLQYHSTLGHLVTAINKQSRKTPNPKQPKSLGQVLAPKASAKVGQKKAGGRKITSTVKPSSKAPALKQNTSTPPAVATAIEKRTRKPAGAKKIQRAIADRHKPIPNHMSLVPAQTRELTVPKDQVKAPVEKKKKTKSLSSVLKKGTSKVGRVAKSAGKALASGTANAVLGPKAVKNLKHIGNILKS